MIALRSHEAPKLRIYALICALSLAAVNAYSARAENDPEPAIETRSDLASQDFAKAVDIVVISEAYGASQSKKFFADVKRMTKMLREGSASAPLRKAFKLNVHAVFCPSKVSGAPWSPGQGARSTAFRARVSADGLIKADYGEAEAIAAENVPDLDVAILLINFMADDAPNAHPSAHPDVVAERSEVRAWADMPADGARILMPSHDTASFVHELGHALLGLGDEYYDEPPTALPPEDAWQIALCPNISTDSRGQRWSQITPNVYEGGGTYAHGVYRGERSCRMNQTRSRDFCSVCRQAMNEVARDQSPQKPRWLSPKSRSSLGASPSGQKLKWPLTASWESASNPVYWELTITRVNDQGETELIEEDYLEGHLRSLNREIKIPGPGQYRVSLRAVNVAGRSSATRRTVKVEKDLNSLGATGALRGSQ